MSGRILSEFESRRKDDAHRSRSRCDSCRRARRRGRVARRSAGQGRLDDAREVEVLARAVGEETERLHVVVFVSRGAGERVRGEKTHDKRFLLGDGEDKVGLLRVGRRDTVDDLERAQCEGLGKRDGGGGGGDGGGEEHEREGPGGGRVEEEDVGRLALV